MSVEKLLFQMLEDVIDFEVNKEHMDTSPVNAVAD
jgi:hypothetical protein